MQKKMNLTSKTNCPCMGMRKLEDGMVPPQSWWQEKDHPQLGQAEVMFEKWLMLLQLSKQNAKH